MKQEKSDLQSISINHKNKSLRRLDLSFLKHIRAKEYKISDLLAYWINDFANYHDEEKTFDNSKLITFKRGSIIKANLGFNVGHEMDGLHYCIVLDKFDNPKNGTLNVIPLTSKKNKKYPMSSLDLGDEFYSILNNFYNKQLEILSKKYENIFSLSGKEAKQFISDFEYVRKINKELSKMKKGSVVLVNQITTISKQRIYDDDILKKVKLSKNSLDLLDKK